MCFHIGRTFSQITWFPYPVKPMGWWITLNLYRYQVLSVYIALSLPSSANCEAVNQCLNVVSLIIYWTHPSMNKYFPIQHRPFSTPAPVQRYMDTSMPKSKAGSLGRSFTLSCGGRGFISPTRELPRWVKLKWNNHFRRIKSNMKTESVGKIHGTKSKIKYVDLIYESTS